jgi:hypothetical protein
MHHLFRIIVSTVFAVSVLTAGPVPSVTPVSAATLAATTTCSNGVDNTGGLGLICEVTIANTITPTGGSATITVRECHGPAGDPEAACTTETTVLSAPVTAVDQCNDATNGGGATLRCSVVVTNEYVGLGPTITAATVNQCVGSGDGFTTGCDPFPATTSGATITQCNGSANGGTLVELTCTATGTRSSGFSLSINQCNNSTNGGGGLVICSTSTSDTVTAAPTPSPTPADKPDGKLTAPPTDTMPGATTGGAGPQSMSWAVVLLGLLATAFVLSRKRVGRDD